MKVISPLSVSLCNKSWTKCKSYRINLNWYRNWHYIISNNIKHEFWKVILDQIEWKTLETPIRIVYTLFVGDNRTKDVNNILSIVDKFFQDVLVVNGVIPDDNYHHVQETVFTYWGMDKWNERIEIVLETI